MSFLLGRHLDWSDEFDGPTGSPPNSQWWRHELGDGSDTGNPGWGNGELQRYTDRAANACHDGRGNLAIRVTNENGGYNSARIITKGLLEFTFGRIEARARVPRERLAVMQVNWPPFRPDSRHNLEGLRLCSSTGLCLTIINELN